jgi:antitoxin PrlF
MCHCLTLKSISIEMIQLTKIASDLLKVCYTKYAYILYNSESNGEPFMRAIVAERGQITIPKSLRQRLGLKPGTVLDINIKDSALIAVKADQQDPIDQVYGCLTKNVKTDNIIQKLRGKADVHGGRH